MANLPTTDLTTTDIETKLAEDTNKVSELCQSNAVVADYLDPTYVSGNTPQERLNTLQSAGYKMGDFRNYGEQNIFDVGADVRWVSFSMPENQVRNTDGYPLGYRPIFALAVDASNWKTYLFAFISEESGDKTLLLSVVNSILVKSDAQHTIEEINPVIKSSLWNETSTSVTYRIFIPQTYYDSGNGNYYTSLRLATFYADDSNNYTFELKETLVYKEFIFLGVSVGRTPAITYDPVGDKLIVTWNGSGDLNNDIYNTTFLDSSGWFVDTSTINITNSHSSVIEYGNAGGDAVFDRINANLFRNSAYFELQEGTSRSIKVFYNGIGDDDRIFNQGGFDFWQSRILAICEYSFQPTDKSEIVIMSSIEEYDDIVLVCANSDLNNHEFTKRLDLTQYIDPDGIGWYTTRVYLDKVDEYTFVAYTMSKYIDAYTSDYNIMVSAFLIDISWGTDYPNDMTISDDQHITFSVKVTSGNGGVAWDSDTPFYVVDNFILIGDSPIATLENKYYTRYGIILLNKPAIITGSFSSFRQLNYLYPFIDSSPSSIVLPSKATRFYITINIMQNEDWEVKSNLSWVTLSDTGGTGPSNIIADVSDYTGSTQRSGDLVFGFLSTNYDLITTTTVIQNPPYITITPNINTDYTSDTYTITVDVPDGFAWTMSKSATWLTWSNPDTGAENDTSGVGPGTTDIIVDLNTNTSQRSDTITGLLDDNTSITDTLTITQEGGPEPDITVSPTSYTADPAGESFNLSINVTPEGEPWTLSSYDSTWITTGTDTGSGDSSVSITVSINKDSARNTTIYANLDNYSAQASCYISQDSQF